MNFSITDADYLYVIIFDQLLKGICDIKERGGAIDNIHVNSYAERINATGATCWFSMLLSLPQESKKCVEPDNFHSYTVDCINRICSKWQQEEDLFFNKQVDPEEALLPGIKYFSTQIYYNEEKYKIAIARP